MWDFAFNVSVQPIITLNINIIRKINPVTHSSESLEQVDTELHSMCEINRQYCEHQGFSLQIFSLTGLCGLNRINRTQNIIEDLRCVSSPPHLSSAFSLWPRRRHGMCDVIARAHTQHMLSPGFNQTTAVSFPAHVASGVQ